DVETNFVELLLDLKVCKITKALKKQRCVDMSLLESKKIASQYQKVANKCNSGMETSAEATEKAEMTLVSQTKLTTLWELRASSKMTQYGSVKE
ncbi:hypothetical protein A2U01_0068819, partial [Trifolium medium]|nr:hypothetical protein [Trifolium medium]